MSRMGDSMSVQREVEIRSGQYNLSGELIIPSGATGVVLFAHGSGSSRFSPRNQRVAWTIRDGSIGTLLFDLLTNEEEQIDVRTRQLRFDIGLLAERLIDATKWLAQQNEAAGLSVGYFGSSTGGAAALVAAAELGTGVKAVVSRGGRPDLAGKSLKLVRSPVLLIVGGFDEQVIELNEQAYALLDCEKDLRIVPGATHLFEEPGTLEEVARLATVWFATHLQPLRTRASGRTS